MSRTKPTMAIVIVAALLAGGALAARVSASAQSVEQNPAPAADVMNYKTQTGPEMTPLAAASGVVRFARMAEQYGELTVSTAHATFAQAEAAVGGVAEIAEWRQSPAYLVVFKTTNPGGRFIPNVPTPAGHTGPSGTVMALIVDAHTGFVEGRYVGSETPPLNDLGPVATMNVTAESTTAFAASVRARERAPGDIIGRLYVHGRATAGWRIVIARSTAKLTSRPVKTLRTMSGGEFFVRVHPGKYVIGAEGAKRKLCGVHSFTVPARPETRVTVRCG
jgi:hypothetical protein